MKFDKEMVKQLILIIVGVLAGLFGYDVIQGDDEVTIAMPEAAEEAEAEDAEESEPSEEPAAEEEAAEEPEEAEEAAE